jgi:hypothetical protein
MQMSVAANHGVFFNPLASKCDNDPYQCDCDECADERCLDRARQTEEGETL